MTSERLQWEEIPSGTNAPQNPVYKARVCDGWLVRCGQSIVFVPDQAELRQQLGIIFMAIALVVLAVVLK